MARSRACWRPLIGAATNMANPASMPTATPRCCHRHGKPCMPTTTRRCCSRHGTTTRQLPASGVELVVLQCMTATTSEVIAGHTKAGRYARGVRNTHVQLLGLQLHAHDVLPIVGYLRQSRQISAWSQEPHVQFLGLQLLDKCLCCWCWVVDFDDFELHGILSI